MDSYSVKNNFPGRIVAIVLICVGSVGLASGASKSTLVPLGGETYSVVRQANTGLTRDTATLKAEALEDASKYCATQGKQLKIISAIEMKPLFMTADYARAKVIFKALNAGDPDLKTDSLSRMPGEISEKPAVPIQGDLYTELIKLDELRQKGILTDDEFRAEKKKVLNRSQ